MLLVAPSWNMDPCCLVKREHMHGSLWRPLLANFSDFWHKKKPFKIVSKIFATANDHIVFSPCVIHFHCLNCFPVFLLV
uniref:Uncharacterized protein n=1 Tax=Zea mays TaxID=4577 RepID=C4J5D0_MAIZE|nr:unknown [Zea mays]